MYNLNIFEDNFFIDLRCFQIGFEKCVPGHHYGPVARGNYLLHFITSGQGTLLYRDSANNDQRFDLSKGSGFLLHPNQIATYYANNENPWEYYWIELNGIQMNNIISNMGLTYNNPIYYSDSYQEFKKTEFSFREFIQKSNTKDDLFILSHTYSILSLLVNNSKTRKNYSISKYSKLTNEIIEYINTNYTSISNSQDIAYEFKISGNHLADLFKKEYDMTLNKFLNNFKMNKVKELLINPELSISEIAYSLNYSNPFNFSRAFKNEFHLSPSEWRKTIN